jgi:hypothetical protein
VQRSLNSSECIPKKIVAEGNNKLFAVENEVLGCNLSLYFAKLSKLNTDSHNHSFGSLSIKVLTVQTEKLSQ